MKTKVYNLNLLLFASACAWPLASIPGGSLAAAPVNVGYVQTNLLGDLPGLARHTDPLLLNPWGIVAGPASVWVNQNHSGITAAYGPGGALSHFAIHIPGPGGNLTAGTPTGLELNRTTQFDIAAGSKHGPSTFLMATEDGTILAWNHAVTGTNAVIVVDRSASGAIYKGLTIAPGLDGSPLIYAANFHLGLIDVFDGNFNYVQSFTDPSVPPGFAPFNVRTIRGHLFVTFAKQKLPEAEDDESGPGNGYVDIFDSDGTLLRRFASEGPLNSPWGLVVAPRNFGKFSHALLVGNFGDGRIHAYDLLTGKHLGNLTRPSGEDVVIEGLWGLTFERDEVPELESLFTADRLYFTAGVGDEEHGLFGIIRPVSRKAR